MIACEHSIKITKLIFAKYIFFSWRKKRKERMKDVDISSILE